jgi:hypothetical protein
MTVGSRKGSDAAGIKSKTARPAPRAAKALDRAFRHNPGLIARTSRTFPVDGWTGGPVDRSTSWSVDRFRITPYALRSVQPLKFGFVFSLSVTGKFTSVPYDDPLKKLPTGNT